MINFSILNFIPFLFPHLFPSRLRGIKGMGALKPSRTLKGTHSYKTLSKSPVGREPIKKMACSSSLLPCFVNNDYVTAESICSTVHAPHEVPTWSWATLSCKDMWASSKEQCILQLPHSYAHWATRGENIAYLLLWLLCQPEENTAMAAVSTRRKQMCLQLLWLLKSSSSLLAHSLPGFSEQCEEQDNRHHQQGQQYLPHFLFVEKGFQRAHSNSY